MEISFDRLPHAVGLLLDKVEALEKQNLKLLEALSEKNNPSSHNDENLTIKELAAYLNCSEITIHNYKKRKVIPYYQTGRKIFFKKSEVDQALSVKLNNKSKR